MVGGVDIGLDREEVFGIAKMSSHMWRHLVHGFEDTREDFRVNLDKRIPRVTDVKAHGPVVGIDSGFDGIANVIS